MSKPESLDAENSRLRYALGAIHALDFEKTSEGTYDLYSGPACFVKAWLIADAALAPTPVREQDA